MTRLAGLVVIVAATCAAATAAEPLDRYASAPAAELDFERRRSAETSARTTSRDRRYRAPSEPVRDNGFLIEEAFNQERTDIQHITNLVFQWDRYAGTPSRKWLYAYTIDIPLGSQKHEFSAMFTMAGGRESRPAGRIHDAGFGDTLLNYRYQLLADANAFWCTPRVSVILPTGDPAYRLGVGELGYEFALPVSRYGERWDVHWNVAYTYFPQLPSVVLPNLIDLENNLEGWTFGTALLYKGWGDVQPFVELMAYANTGYGDPGTAIDFNQVIINPGARFALTRTDDFEWVVGASVPIGLTPITPDVGVFFYMSLEHAFRD
ncbi:MAG: hypothetical protein QM775_33485 [Pirellulales bacterium]